MSWASRAFKRLGYRIEWMFVFMSCLIPKVRVSSGPLVKLARWAGIEHQTTLCSVVWATAGRATERAFDTLEMAMAAERAGKMRAVLIMLGVVMFIFAVVVMFIFAVVVAVAMLIMDVLKYDLLAALADLAVFIGVLILLMAEGSLIMALGRLSAKHLCPVVIDPANKEK